MVGMFFAEQLVAVLVEDADVHGPCVKVDPAVVAVAFGVELHVALGVVELAIVGGYSGGLISINTMQQTMLRIAADRDRRWTKPLRGSSLLA